MVLAFARYIVRPADGLHGVSHLMQKPFFRLVGQGPAWVALFFILMGFVNALRPIKLARAGEVESALKNLGVSSFKRSFRLFLPATTATILSWFVCQLGAYETARQSDAYWLYTTSPLPSESWGTAVVDLLSAIRQTWSFLPDNPYDQPQWALLYLFQGSMFVFTALLVTVNLKPYFRVAVLVLCYFWSFTWSIKIGDRMFKALCMQNLANFVWQRLSVSTSSQGCSWSNSITQNTLSFCLHIRYTSLRPSLCLASSLCLSLLSSSPGPTGPMVSLCSPQRLLLKILTSAVIGPQLARSY